MVRIWIGSTYNPNPNLIRVSYPNPICTVTTVGCELNTVGCELNMNLGKKKF